eukprot:scaffold4191_cov76-Skeletonema_dohrnii-CCMP3373.AAC.2
MSKHRLSALPLRSTRNTIKEHQHQLSVEPQRILMPPFSSFFVDKSLVENDDSSNNAASNFSQHEICYSATTTTTTTTC